MDIETKEIKEIRAKNTHEANSGKKTEKKGKKKSCLDKALAKLNYRMRTESELRKSLKEDGYEEGEIEETVEELKNFGYLDDARYIREYYKVSKRKGWADRRILNELKRKGIKSDFADNTIQDFKDSDEFSDLNLEEDEKVTAYEVGVKMAKSQINAGKALDDKFMAKVGRRLMSLGYNSGCCYYVIGKLRNYNPEEE